MPDIDTRVDTLETNHRELKAEVSTTAQTLHRRIDLTEEAVRVNQRDQAEGMRAMRNDIADGRRDAATGQAQLQATMVAVQTDAFQSLPKWAADERALAAKKAEADGQTKGLLLGGVISMIAVVVVLLIAMFTHMVQ